jgi:hypothetical protein
LLFKRRQTEKRSNQATRIRHSTTEQEAVATWPFRQAQLKSVTGGIIKTDQDRLTPA